MRSQYLGAEAMALPESLTRGMENMLRLMTDLSADDETAIQMTEKAQSQWQHHVLLRPAQIRHLVHHCNVDRPSQSRPLQIRQGKMARHSV